MSYKLKGTVKAIFDTMTFDSGFTKREFVVTTAGKYPQDIKFETVRDKTSLCDKFNEGDEITVHFDVRGNEYKGKYYVNLNCWRVESGEQADPGAYAPPPEPPTQSAELPMDAEEEDPPF